MIRQITIIGVGLIGGSLARALRRDRFCQSIMGCSRDAEHLQKAQQLGVIDRFELNMADAVRDSELVVIAVPVGQTEAVFNQLHPVLTPGTVVTDVGSVKGSVVSAARNAGMELGDFVPGHPIAGTEKSGVGASFAALFEDKSVILTPLRENRDRALETVTSMWRATRATVITMEVQHHDQVLAASSHLPHVLAYNLVDCLAKMSNHQEIFQMAAGGFRDFTRIASSDPRMWIDISLANQQAILEVLDQYRDDLETLIEAIRDKDEHALERIYQNAKRSRDRYCQEQDHG